VEYFHEVVSTRLDQVDREWTYIYGKIQLALAVNGWSSWSRQATGQKVMTPDQKGEEASQPSLHEIRQLHNVLIHLSETLHQTIQMTRRVLRPIGDGSPMFGITEPASALSSGSCQSLASISTSLQDLEDIQDGFEKLIQPCERSIKELEMKDLAWRSDDQSRLYRQQKLLSMIMAIVRMLPPLLHVAKITDRCLQVLPICFGLKHLRPVIAFGPISIYAHRSTQLHNLGGPVQLVQLVQPCCVHRRIHQGQARPWQRGLHISRFKLLRVRCLAAAFDPTKHGMQGRQRCARPLHRAPQRVDSEEISHWILFRAFIFKLTQFKTGNSRMQETYHSDGG